MRHQHACGKIFKCWSQSAILTSETEGSFGILAVSVGFLMDDARSAPQGAHYHTDEVYIIYTPVNNTFSHSTSRFVMPIDTI